jgi:hypothetical protein
MTYASGVNPQQLAAARLEVVTAERSDGFYEDLIQRDYWVAYLKEKHPDVFKALDEVEVMDVDQDAGADDPAFLSQLFDHAAARNAKLIELSRKEVADIESSTSGAGSSVSA